ncbi:hypothetical protein Bca4012_102053 [Brassica carinata]
MDMVIMVMVGIITRSHRTFEDHGEKMYVSFLFFSASYVEIITTVKENVNCFCSQLCKICCFCFKLLLGLHLMFFLSTNEL